VPGGIALKPFFRKASLDAGKPQFGGSLSIRRTPSCAGGFMRCRCVAECRRGACCCACMQAEAQRVWQAVAPGWQSGALALLLGDQGRFSCGVQKEACLSLAVRARGSPQVITSRKV